MSFLKSIRVPGLTSGRYRGHLDSYKNGALVGWVYDRTAPERPVTVHVYIDDMVCGSFLAKIHREDVKALGIGTGDYGFEYIVPRTFRDGKHHRLRILLDGGKKCGSGDLSLPRQVLLEPQALTREASYQSFRENIGKGDLPTPEPLSSDLSVLLNRSARYLRQRELGQFQLSIIIPTYNRSRTLRETLEKIYLYAQGFKFEVIVVNDGSTDDTEKVLEQLASTFSDLIWRSIPNGGPGQARNVAADLARSDILLFMGDDTSPIDRNFLASHWLAHERYPEQYQAVLGKIRWTDERGLAPNFVMSHIQGQGQEQFGYAFMHAYEQYDWRLFYSSNVSVKKEIVSAWKNDGYSKDFCFAAMEDPEFAYRMTKKFGRFEVIYVPAAVLVHDHPYSVTDFLGRQRKAGAMAKVFLEKHPEAAKDLGLKELHDCLRISDTENSGLSLEHYMNVCEGVRSWACILDEQYGLGSQNWHGAFLSAVFALAYREGFLLSNLDSDVDPGPGYRKALEAFRADLNALLLTEALAGQSDIHFV